MPSTVLGGPAPRRAFVHLCVMSSKDVLRNPLAGLSMVFMFAMMLGVYVAIWLAFTVVGPPAAVSVDGADAELVIALERSGVTVVDTGAADRNGRISVVDGQALVTLDTSLRPAWNPIWTGLRDAGVPADGITVVDGSGEVATDPLRANLGVTLMTGLASLAFIGTAVPLVATRERGLLRLFGTTPLRRSTFLLSQLPARALMALLFAAATVAIALWQRYVDAVDLLRLGITLALGASMLSSFAMLFAARSRNAESTQQSMVMVTIVLTFASGGLLPPSMVPAAVQIVMNSLPTTWVAAAASATLTGAEPFLPLPMLWALMAVAAIGAAVTAVRMFEWDQQEPSPKRSRTPRGERTAA